DANLPPRAIRRRRQLGAGDADHAGEGRVAVVASTSPAEAMRKLIVIEYGRWTASSRRPGTPARIPKAASPTVAGLVRRCVNTAATKRPVPDRGRLPARTADL